MSSLHNDLATWAGKARARGEDTIYLDLETVEQIVEALTGSRSDSPSTGRIEDPTRLKSSEPPTPLGEDEG